MFLTPTELERLTIYTAAELARKRRLKGLKLNYPEATAIIADEILEGAREGKSVAELIDFGATILNSSDVLDGVQELLSILQIEASFPDGTKLVTVHDPIRPHADTPKREQRLGDIICPDEFIELSPNKPRASVIATNTGDRPIQVGSHYHFFETNKALDFDRSITFGMHLDIPAGTAVRFEPGESKEVHLVQFGGTGELFGFAGLTNGCLHDEAIKLHAIERARAEGFKGA